MRFGPTESESRVRQSRRQNWIGGKGPYQVKPKAKPSAPAHGKTLHEATKEYVASLERKNVSESHKDNARQMMITLTVDRRLFSDASEAFFQLKKRRWISRLMAMLGEKTPAKA
jgi:hypothetical protein